MNTVQCTKLYRSDLAADDIVTSPNYIRHSCRNCVEQITALSDLLEIELRQLNTSTAIGRRLSVPRRFPSFHRRRGRGRRGRGRRERARSSRYGRYGEATFDK
ncbi:hypothetical protein EVAR_54859_1 [Eumeta japonica]|uniref:Uncharacterized protein n=1 Tax=Eumeta variegata TaxID=151549 RepID=A0A4C1YH93_EUMVA|nr:hypothetical protein EVAR_54859_1 [Eumeta japonica]